MKNNFKKLSDYRYMLYNQNGFKQAILEAYMGKGCKQLDNGEIKNRIYEEYNSLIKPQLTHQYPTHYPCIMVPQLMAWYESGNMIVSFIYKSDFENEQ